MRFRLILFLCCVALYAQSFALAPAPPSPTVVGTSTVCVLNPATMIASISPDDPDVVFKWYNTGSALDLIPVYTGDTFTTAPLLTSRSYFVESYNTVTLQKSSRVEFAITVQVLNPDVPVGTPDKAIICSGDSASITASSTSGATTFKWYDALAGGNLLHSGAVYNTGALTTTTTFYLESEMCVALYSARTPVVITVIYNTDVPLTNVADPVICSGASTTVSATSVTGNTIFKWYDAATGGNLLHTGASYNTGALSSTTTFYVATVNGSGCNSVRSAAIVAVINNADVPLAVAANPTPCYGTSTTITASSLIGNTIFKWYDAATGGNLVYTGNPLNTGAVTTTTSFYVASVDGSGCSSARTQAIISPLPAVNPPSVTPPSAVVCSGQNTTFTANSILGGAATYRWYDALFNGNLLGTGQNFNTGTLTNNGTNNVIVTYYAELEDATGCRSSRTPAAVILRPALNLALVNPPVTTICSGDSVSLSATSVFTGGVSYKWYDALSGGNLLFTGNPYNTGALNNSGTGNLTVSYYVELEDTSGCKSLRAPAIVVIRPALNLPVVTPPAAAICSGDSAQFVASNVLGSPGTYRWYSTLAGGTLLHVGDTFKTGAMQNTGGSDLLSNYYVEFEDANGCKSLRTSASLVTRPALNVATVNPPTTLICSGQSAVFTASSVLGSAATFKWYDAAAAGTLLFTGNPFNSGAISNTSGTEINRTYYAEVVDSNGCKSIRTPAIVIVRPLLDVAVVNPPASIICSGNSVTLTGSSALGSGVLYNWYDALLGGTKLFTGNPFTTGPIVNTSGTQVVKNYYAELEDTAGCKSLRTPAVVTVRPALDVPVVNPPVTTVCSGYAATLTATSLLGTAVEYSWYDSLLGGSALYTGNPYTTTVINNNGASDLTRTYYVELTDTAGCKSVRTPAVVVARPALDVPIASPLSSLICSGDSVTLTASSLLGTAATYHWYDALVGGSLLFSGDTVNTGAINNNSGTDLTRIYYVEVEDTAGCKSLRTPATVVIRPALDVPIAMPIASIICSGDSVTLTASSLLGTAATYNWYDSLVAGHLLFSGDTVNTGAIVNSNGTQLTRIYYLELVDTSGCKSIRTPATVVIRPALDIPLVVPPLTLICSGDSVTMTASSLLGTAATYNWYDSLLNGNLLYTGNPFHTGAIVNASGLELSRTYYVELVDTGGCKSIRTPSIVVVRPALDVPIAMPVASLICSGDSVTFTASSVLGTAATYSWYDSLLATKPLFVGNPYNTGAINNKDVSDLTRIYYVELADTAGCKSLRTPATVIIRPALDVPLVIPPVQNICSGYTTRFVATSALNTAVSFQWYDALLGGNQVAQNDTFQTPILYATAIYYVELTDTAGCKSIRTPAIALVTPNPDQPSATPEDSMLCVGQMTTISAQSLADTSYNWYTTLTGGTPIFTGPVLSTGAITSDTIFYVEGVSVLGCLSLRTAAQIKVYESGELVQANVSCASTTETSITFHWDAVPFAAAYQVSMDNGVTWNNPSSGTRGLTHTVGKTKANQTEASILVKTLTNLSCVVPSNTTSMPRTCRFEKQEDLAVFYNSFSPNGDGVNDVWFLTNGLENYPDNEVSVFDRWGREIYRQIGYNPNDPNKVFKGNDLDDGSYFYIFRIPSKSFEKTGYVMIIR